jgi:hypothetical protein
MSAAAAATADVALLAYRSQFKLECMMKERLWTKLSSCGLLTCQQTHKASTAHANLCRSRGKITGVGTRHGSQLMGFSSVKDLSYERAVGVTRLKTLLSKVTSSHFAMVGAVVHQSLCSCVSVCCYPADRSPTLFHPAACAVKFHCSTVELRLAQAAAQLQFLP